MISRRHVLTLLLGGYVAHYAVSLLAEDVSHQRIGVEIEERKVKKVAPKEQAGGKPKLDSGQAFLVAVEGKPYEKQKK